MRQLVEWLIGQLVEMLQLIKVIFIQVLNKALQYKSATPACPAGRQRCLIVIQKVGT